MLSGKGWIGEVQTPMPQNSPQRPCPLEVHFAFGIEELIVSFQMNHLSDHQHELFSCYLLFQGALGPGQTALDTGCPDLQGLSGCNPGCQKLVHLWGIAPGADHDRILHPCRWNVHHELARLADVLIRFFSVSTVLGAQG